jgi:hypothetical protein
LSHLLTISTRSGRAMVSWLRRHRLTQRSLRQGYYLRADGWRHLLERRVGEFQAGLAMDRCLSSNRPNGGEAPEHSTVRSRVHAHRSRPLLLTTDPIPEHRDDPEAARLCPGARRPANWNLVTYRKVSHEREQPYRLEYLERFPIVSCLLPTRRHLGALRRDVYPPCCGAETNSVTSQRSRLLL